MDAVITDRMTKRLLEPLRASIARAEFAARGVSDDSVGDALIGAMIAAVLTEDPRSIERLPQLAEMIARSSRGGGSG